MEELIKRKRFTPSKPKVKASKYDSSRFDEQKGDNVRMVQQAMIYWSNLSDARKRANRTFDYYIGDQWSDTMTVEDKYGTQTAVTEEQYILNNGRIPFVQNIMLQIGKNIVGQYESAPSKSIVQSRNREDQKRSDMLSGALQESLDLNHVDIMEPRQLEAFINSGFILSKVGWEYWPEKDRPDVKITSVNYNNICFNAFSDPTGDGLNFICEIIDTDIESLISTFARNEADEEAIRRMYPGNGDNNVRLTSSTAIGSGDEIKNNDFSSPADISKCRVYAIWEKRGEWRMREHDYLKGTLKTTRRTAEQINIENLQRERYCSDNGVQCEPTLHLIDFERRYEEYWYYKFITPNYACLAYGESPFEHQSHPYIITAHPLLNGRIWSFNETLIDSQRQVNRLLSLQDALLGGAAKNLTVIDAKAMEGEHSDDRETIIDETGKINGVVVLDTGNQGDVSRVIKNFTGNSASLGIQDMVSSYINLILQISGVSQAIQGQRANSNTPSSLYAQEAQNSQINVLDIMTTFKLHKELRDTKALKVILQYKNDGVLKSTKSNKESMMYKSAEARAVKNIDVVVTQAMDTPVYRSLMDDRLSMFVDKGLMDLKMYAELSSEPFAEPLLELIHKRESESQGQPLTPEQAQQLQGVQQQIQQSDTRTPQQQQLVAQALGR